MKALFALPFAALAATIVLTPPAPAEAKGCIKGALVGGVAGHMVGHGKMGALAGCVVGHHRASRADTNANRPMPETTSNTQNR